MNCHRALYPLLSVVFMAGLAGVACIRVSHLIVPAQVGRGHDAQLHCHFNLGGNILYSVKWFKGSREFFRIGPDGTRPQVFPHLSNMTVDRSNAGTYRCEVSCEGPHFETDFREANMSVIDLPLQGPIIINVQTSYLPGERVALNCTSAPSKPMAILQWSIDGEQVGEPYVKRYIDGSIPTLATQSSEPNSRQSTWQNGRENDGELAEDNVATVGLEFVVDLPKQISAGAFATRRVSCTALVGDIYQSVTYANLSIVDGRSAKAIATARTPSHLLHSANGSSANWPRSHSTSWIGLVFCYIFYLIRQTAVDTTAAVP
ncbi:uncharacterized protein LOC130700650 isoform X2 [Daphnia carinata]|uniref:uncharacterized protein LOC130700650 isoform X2 n=1 Tax=Daphnia carinata TaxID=120202 RepID=UPI00257BA0BD|nr:uncharacterized protein LOC130700650 isoform X2 [Daphnia carinata]